jgi:hypothetical protein
LQRDRPARHRHPARPATIFQPDSDLGVRRSRARAGLSDDEIEAPCAGVAVADDYLSRGLIVAASLICRAPPAIGLPQIEPQPFPRR